MHNKVHLIPAAGTATRMGGIPKFLLPTQSSSGSPDQPHLETLLGHHVKLGLNSCDKTIIASRPENMTAIQKYLIPGRVEAMCMESSTMSETIARMVSVIRAEIYFVTMPDTYFLNSNFKMHEISPTTKSGELVRLGAWDVLESQVGSVGQIQLDGSGAVIGHKDKTADASLPLVWGAIAFRAEAESLIDTSTPHIGYLIDSARDASFGVSGKRFTGVYLDCGTPQGYLDLLNRNSERLAPSP